jgi:hypothetical protein
MDRTNKIMIDEAERNLTLLMHIEESLKLIARPACSGIEIGDLNVAGARVNRMRRHVDGFIKDYRARFCPDYKGANPIPIETTIDIFDTSVSAEVTIDTGCEGGVSVVDVRVPRTEYKKIEAAYARYLAEENRVAAMEEDGISNISLTMPEKPTFESVTRRNV